MDPAPTLHLGTWTVPEGDTPPGKELHRGSGIPRRNCDYELEVSELQLRQLQFPMSREFPAPAHSLEYICIPMQEKSRKQSRCSTQGWITVKGWEQTPSTEQPLLHRGILIQGCAGGHHSALTGRGGPETFQKSRPMHKHRNVRGNCSFSGFHQEHWGSVCCCNITWAGSQSPPALPVLPVLLQPALGRREPGEEPTLESQLKDILG